ncbi:unnamed protein product, partial [marine sediment metagenome]
IYSLDMSYCDQDTITDKAFENLKGIHMLNMSGCDQETIINDALKWLNRTCEVKLYNGWIIFK